MQLFRQLISYVKDIANCFHSHAFTLFCFLCLFRAYFLGQVVADRTKESNPIIYFGCCVLCQQQTFGRRYTFEGSQLELRNQVQQIKFLWFIPSKGKLNFCRHKHTERAFLRLLLSSSSLSQGEIQFPIFVTENYFYAGILK